jgi:hypothetical protein
MNIRAYCLSTFAAASLLVTGNVSGQVRLTDITLFTTDSAGNYAGYDTWDTMPTNAVPDTYNLFIQSGAPGGPFLTGPSSAHAQPNISLSLGASTFSLFGFPGFETAYYGINLFFNGSTNPSISAFAPMLTATGPHSFSVDTSATTLSVGPFGSHGISQTIPAAGTLSFAYGSQLITLTDFYWDSPSVNNLNVVGPWSTGADPSGRFDNVGGITFSVAQIPEPNLALWGLGLIVWRISVRRWTTQKC